MKKRILFLIPLLLFGFLFAALRPIPKASPNNTIKIKAFVKAFSVAGTKDIVFHLEGDDNIYYINRGEEKGLRISDLEKEILQKEVLLYYIKHWSPLDPKNQTRHIAKLVFENEVIYNEM